MSNTLVHVRVLNAAERAPLPGAVVSLVPRVDRPMPSMPEAVKLELEDEARGLFVGTLDPGDWVLRVSHPELAPEQRALRVGERPVEELVLLGREGQEGYFRGRVRVPFDHDPGLLAVVLAEGAEPASLELPAGRRGWALERDEGLLAQGIVLLRQTTPGGGEAEELAGELRELSVVRLVGPLVYRADGQLSILAPRLAVRFAPDLPPERVAKIVHAEGLSPERRLAWAPQSFVFRLEKPTASLSPLAICARLRDLPEVVYAEPLLVHTLVDHGVTPVDALFSLQWTHALVGLPEAWQTLRALNAAGVNPGDPGDITYGSAQRVVAILDTNGVETDAAGVPLHPDLAGTVSDGSAKAAAFYDFKDGVAHNGAAGLSGHGTRCAGVAVGRADNLDGGAAYGVSGAAGNARYVGVRVWVSSTVANALAGEEQLADAIVWAAGLETGLAAPAPLATPADVLSLSFGVPGGWTAQHLSDALDAVTTFGRGGRGAVVVASAGNESREIIAGEPLRGHPCVITVAASSLLSEAAEGTTAYTNYGAPVSLCAPTSNGATLAPPPPRSLHVHSADRLSEADGPGRVAFSTTLAADAAAGALTITVADTTGIAVGDGLIIGDPLTGDVEARRVISVSGAQVGIGTAATLVSPTAGGLDRAHAASGSAVWAGPRSCTATFGQTSAAAPLVAGTAALMLSARPTLTWVEVRDLLRATAVEIDPLHPEWSAGFNPRFGHGRLDAAAAVVAARDHAGADLVIRENLQDQGSVPSPGWHAHSPDLWVRNAVEAAPNLAYDAGPPHQDPIRGQANTVWVRVKNVGSQPSSTAKARVLVAHFPGIEFVYPEDWTPDVPPASTADPLLPGSYELGEVEVPSLLAGGVALLSLSWAAGLVPPEEVTVNGLAVRWHPCLLAEVTPQDGPIDAGGAISVRASNNLAQRNLSVADPSSGAAVGVVAGSRGAGVDALILDWAGARGAGGIALQTPDPARMGRWTALATPQPRGNQPPPSGSPPGCLGALGSVSGWLAALGRLRALPASSPAAAPASGASLVAGAIKGRPALLWQGPDRLELPLGLLAGERALIAISLQGAKGELHLRQRLTDGRVVGGYTIRTG